MVMVKVVYCRDFLLYTRKNFTSFFEWILLVLLCFVTLWRTLTTMLWIFKKLMFLYPNEYISFGFHESIAGLPKISTENSIIRFGNPHFIFNCFFFWKSYPFFSQNYYLIHLNTIHFSWFVATSGDNVDKDLNLFWKMLLYVYIFFNIKIMLLNCVHLFQPKQ